MFKFPRMKLYRKLLVLGVMIAALMVVSPARQLLSDPCCDACDAAYVSCVEYCYSGQIKDWMIPGCLSDCANEREICRNICYPQPGPECPVS